ncbi:MAG: hypothetical protein EBX41_04885 [Chitinophagia bacterium]|nr:hypothetical protein [Chitinophagia bacterium]
MWSRGECKDITLSLYYVKTTYIYRYFGNRNKMKKKFDAIKHMRDIRATLYEKYATAPQLLQKDLEQVRAKYGIKTPPKLKPGD